ncbi:C-type lectin BfL-1-like [Thunnus maccoyii]|uniref:C-type lectin BfL-1-like n=1 Tax=Thunnus maccoyii TaxID=8240 RepID=UPI001C4D20DE|nr:C-type lectin BfL-1-like [Thunnus maccoyii]
MPLICFRDDAEVQYVLVTEEKTWFEAQSYCRQHHTDLVSVRSPAENEEVRDRLWNNTGVQEAWIGLHRDSWKWSDGSSSSFRHWWWLKPDNVNNSQACVTMEKGSWSNWKCSTRFNILCQKITEVTPTPVTEPTTIRPAVQKRTTVKIKFQTDSDLKDPNIRHKVLQQLEAAFNSQGLTDVKLYWRTLSVEPRPQKRTTDACGEGIK